MISKHHAKQRIKTKALITIKNIFHASNRKNPAMA